MPKSTALGYTVGIVRDTDGPHLFLHTPPDDEPAYAIYPWPEPGAAPRFGIVRTGRTGIDRSAGMGPYTLDAAVQEVERRFRSYRAGAVARREAEEAINSFPLGFREAVLVEGQE